MPAEMDREVESMALRYLENGSVDDFPAALRKAKALRAAAEIAVEAAIRIETERLSQAASRPSSSSRNGRRWFTPSNTRRRKDGGRDCIICVRRRAREATARWRAKQSPAA